MLLPNAAAEAQSSPATSTATSTTTATATATPTDYDSDDDGLIDINNLAQLNAVRYDLNGDAKQDTASAADWAIYTAAFSNPASGMGCKPTDHDDDATTDTQPTCKGYELMRDLDFDTDGDGDVDSSDTYANWTPIGTEAKPFESRFEGSLTNGVMPKISNLTITSISGSSVEAGLFGATKRGAHIKNIGLVDVNIDITTSAGYADIGALVGYSLGNITACYSTGAITVAAGRYSTAGGLAGYNGETMAASFSRATVDMSTSGAFYAGGLVGYNGGTIRAAYAAGAVKGTGNNTGYVGGLVGYNLLNIEASYSIAPVTSVGLTPTATSKPHIHGLNNSVSQSGFGRVTASYWDYIASGVPAGAGDARGKSTRELTQASLSSRGYSGIYADWDDLTIDGANDVDPWGFDFDVHGRFHPLLTYGGHTTTDMSGNQLFAFTNLALPGRPQYPTEGLGIVVSGRRTFTMDANYNGAGALLTPSGPYIWQSSTDGITWGSALVSNTVCGVQQDRTCGAAYRATDSDRYFIPRLELGGKYIRAKVPVDDERGYVYTRTMGKVKLASTTAPITVSFTIGNNPPRVGTQLGVVGAYWTLWQRCDTNGANPSGCEYVGSNRTYTPGAGDLNHYLRAYVYHSSTAGVLSRTTSGFTPRVVDIQRPTQWHTLP